MHLCLHLCISLFNISPTVNFHTLFYTTKAKMLPLYLLNSVKGQPVMVELKRGETINGVLDNCDSWMNLMLKDAVISDAHAEKFNKVKEIYVKGIHIKYITMANDLIDKFREEQVREREYYRRRNAGYQRGGYQRGGYRRNYGGNNSNNNGNQRSWNSRPSK